MGEKRTWVFVERLSPESRDKGPTQPCTSHHGQAGVAQDPGDPLTYAPAGKAHDLQAAGVGGARGPRAGAEVDLRAQRHGVGARVLPSRTRSPLGKYFLAGERLGLPVGGRGQGVSGPGEGGGL